MTEAVLRGADLEARREAEAEIEAGMVGEPIAEPLDDAEAKPFSSLVPAIIGAARGEPSVTKVSTDQAGWLHSAR